MAKIAFLGDCYISHKVLIPSSIPKNLVLNWEHADLFQDTKIPGKVSLGLVRPCYKETFGERFIIAGIANNHAADFGAPGIAGAVRQIESAGFKSCGASSEVGVEYAIRVTEFDGKSVAFIFYAHASSSPITQVEGRDCVNAFSRDKVLADVCEAKRGGACYVVAVVHWGAEEVFLPPPDVVSDARFLVESGVDLVIGHHAHVVQPMEVYRGKCIFYGLGNFYFPDIFTTIRRGDRDTPFFKRQAPRNRKSLVVILDTDSFSISCLSCKVDLRASEVKAKPVNHRTSRVLLSDYYPLFFRISYIYGKLNAKLWALALEGRLPRISAFKNMIALLRSKSAK